MGNDERGDAPLLGNKRALRDIEDGREIEPYGGKLDNKGSPYVSPDRNHFNEQKVAMAFDRARHQSAPVQSVEDFIKKPI